LALEPDPSMSASLADDVRSGALPPTSEARRGTTDDLLPDEMFDTVLYIDVLEHIEDDYAEVRRVTRLLVQGGHLIVLVPAHQALYPPFDAAFGHCRRYSMKRLLSVGSGDIRIRRARCLDSVGLLASVANRLVLRAAHPSRGQIHTWDRLMVPASRWTD